MSRRTRKPAHSSSVLRKRQRQNARTASTARTVSTFAALGDRTRLSLLGKLSHGRPCSIAQLTHGSRLTRQAITKHLRVLERAKVVRSVRSGRHALFELDPEPVHALRDYLDRVSAEWDQALARLKSFVEK
jgi:DNA-binding transcriptional ArsR family regulator